MHTIWKENTKRILVSKRAKLYLTSLFFILMVYSYLSLDNSANIGFIHNYKVFFYKMTVYLFIIPCFIFILHDILKFFNHNMVILRLVRVSDWWLQKFISTVIFSTFFSLFLTVCLVLMFMIKGLIIFIEIEFIILGLFSQILGFLIIGSLLEVFSFLIKNKYIAIVSVYLFILFPLAIRGLFYKETFFLVDFMFLQNVKNSNDISFFLLNIVPLIILSLIILLYTGYKQNKKQDLYWVDEKHA